jgi:type I restriction enzyme S subunit
MELKPGYKKTEEGVIPEDWEIRQLSKITDPQRPIGYGIVQTGPRIANGVKCVRVVDLKNGRVDIENLITTSEKISTAYKRTLLAKGDVVVALRGKIGELAVIAEELVGANLTRGVALLAPLDGYDSPYLCYYLSSGRGKQVFERNLNGSALQEIPIATLRKIPVVIPPLPEQRAISAALGEIDALISTLDQLIAKKRDIKQAAMQQLLTGKQRLPGFSGEWVVKTFRELFNFSGGYSASRDQLSLEGHCYLHYGDIHGATKMFIDVRADYQSIPKLDIPLKRVASKSLLEDGDVVFVDASEDDEGSSRHVVVVNKDKKPFISGLHTIVAKSKTDELAHEYRRYCFQTAAIRQQFLFYSVGTKVTGISKTNIAKLAIPVPKIPEQTAIAAVLSDMDSELAALEQRRDKTRALKQGMMQELLTGKTRLV